jgi:hypothetical protein
MRPLGSVRLLALAGMFSVVLVAYGLSARPVHTWNASITATGQVQVGEFEPLAVTVELQPDVLTLPDVGGNVEARVRVPAGDVRLIDPSSVRVCAGYQACGDAGSSPSAFSVDEGEGAASVWFVVADAIPLPAEEELPADGVVVSVAVSGTVGGRTFVGTDALYLMPAAVEPVTDDGETPVASESPTAGSNESPRATKTGDSG